MPVNPKSLKNLKPVKKGEVHNPKGRPLGSPNFNTLIKKALDRNHSELDPLTKKKTKKTIRESIVLQHIALALEGDLSAIKELYDREIGKVPVKQELTGAGGGAIKTESENPLNKLSAEKLEELLKKANDRY